MLTTSTTAPDAQHIAGSKLTTHGVVCVANGFQSNYERGFCNALASHGMCVTLISSDATDRANLLPLVHTLNLRGSQDNRRPKWKKLLNLMRYHAALLAYTPFCAGKIVHMIGNFDPPFLCGVVEGWWFRLWARRYVLTVHDVLPHGRHTAMNQLISRWTFCAAGRLVVHTDRMKRTLIDSYGVAAGKVTVMQHGIEPQQQDGAETQQQRLATEVPTILFFGKVAPYKGVDLLLEALCSITFDFRLVIAGASAYPDYRAQLQAAIDVHPFKGVISWRDAFVEESEMEQLFRAADLLVLPYRHIDQSGVLFQALRFGVPIIATRVGAFEDFVSSDVGELADDPTAEALVRALQRWSVRRFEFSSARIRAIGKGYEWPRTVMALCNTYPRDVARDAPSRA